MALLPTPYSLLKPYQQRWSADSSRFKIWLKSRQIGGSFGAAFEAIPDCITTGQDWMVLSAGERQANEVIRKAHQVADVWVDAFNRSGVDVQCSKLVGSVVFRHRGRESRIFALPAKPETARGFSANLILDEFAFHEKPDEIWKAVLPTITNPLRGELKVRIISTPAGRSGKFYDLVNRAGQLGYNLHRVDIHDAVEDGLAIDVPGLRAALNDEEAWAQEYECQFVDSSSVLLPYDLIDSVASDDATEDTGPIQPWGTSTFVGVDIGRKRDLTVVWTLERVGDVLWTREVLVLEKTPYDLQEELIADRLKRASIGAIDETGIGNAVSERLAERMGHKLLRCTFSQPFKQLIFPALRRACQERRIRIPRSNEIREDLHSVHEIVSENGQKRYRALHTDDGHADRCTALALALHAANDAGKAPVWTSEATANVRMARPVIRTREVVT